MKEEARGKNHTQTKLGVIVPCHNDAPYLRRALAAVQLASAEFDSRVVVIIDRCTDDSLRVAESFGTETIVKERAGWRNSTAENLNLGFLRLLDRDYVGVIAADTVIPREYFEESLRVLSSFPALRSVSGLMFTERTTIFNRLYSSYEVLLEGLGLKHGIRGSGRVYRMSAVRPLYEEVGGVTADVLAEDNLLDEMLRGERRVLENLTCACIRESGPAKSVRGQLSSGMARRQLGVPPARLLGEFARLRPFVAIGFLLYPLVRDNRADLLVSTMRARAK